MAWSKKLSEVDRSSAYEARYFAGGIGGLALRSWDIAVTI